MNKKNLSLILAAHLVVLTIIMLIMIVWSKNQTTTAPERESSSVSMETKERDNFQQPSEEWTEVNHANFWGHPDLFASPDYSFPNIKFSYPKNWNFACCGDMSHGSSHTIFSSQNYDTTLPYIIIMNHSLSGCPDANKSCSIDQLTSKTPNEKLNDLTQKISSNAQVRPKLSLDNLGSDAFVYETTDKNGREIKSFIINTLDGVIEISFVDYELLERSFISSFLAKIEKE